MICTDKEFEQESLVFLNKKWRDFNENHPFDIESLALEHVKSSNNFKYKDHVEAGVLVNFLVKFGYVEFTQRRNDTRFHSLTEKGIDFIKEKKQNRSVY